MPETGKHTEISTEINFWHPKVEFEQASGQKYGRPGPFQYMGPKMGVGPPPRGHFEQIFKFFEFQLIIYVQRSHHANLGHFGKFVMPPGHLLSFLSKSESRGGFGVSQEWGSGSKNFFS